MPKAIQIKNRVYSKAHNYLDIDSRRGKHPIKNTSPAKGWASCFLKCSLIFGLYYKGSFPAILSDRASLMFNFWTVLFKTEEGTKVGNPVYILNL